MKNYGDFGKKLPVDRIKPGYRLLEEVRNKTGGCLFKAGEVICNDDIKTMMRSDVDYVWVHYTDEVKIGKGYIELNLSSESLSVRGEGRQKDVLALSGKGFNPEQIARILDLPTGEVELILNLVHE